MAAAAARARERSPDGVRCEGCEEHKYDDDSHKSGDVGNGMKQREEQRFVSR